MSRTMTVVAAAAVAIASVAADSTLCDPSYECQYTYSNLQTQTQYTFDFTSLCDPTDYVINDNVGHTYYANVCGQAKQNCLPELWTNTYEYGVAVQTWGETPACNHQNPGPCKNPLTKAGVCCTADCQVLGTGAPIWGLLDESNPETGGVVARYKGAAASESDPFWCDFNPSTGAQYEREVHFVFQCDMTEKAAQAVSAVQNSTNDCRYTINFKTQFACANLATGMSAGWIFTIVLLLVTVTYLVVGSSVRFARSHVWGLPNADFWAELGDLVRAGCAFTASGFRRRKGGSSYEDIGTGAGPTYHASSAEAAKATEGFTDL